MTISFSVNGVSHSVDDTYGAVRLIDFLHENLNLTGTKLCCGIGVCRACTVIVTKKQSTASTPMISCSTSLKTLKGAHISTIEDVGKDGVLDPVQEAFLEHFSFQCGYCTPGFVMAAKLFLDRLEKEPVDRSQLDKMMDDAIGSHICRCTGYIRYYEALRPLAEKILANKEIQK